MINLLCCLCNIVVIPNSDSESFNPALWEEQRKQRAQVAFECDEDKDEREAPSKVSGTLIFPCIIGKTKLILNSTCFARSDKKIFV